MAYAAAHELQWIEDESNADDSYPRNFLRHRLLPVLGEKFPVYRDTLTRSAQHFAEASELLDELAHIDAAASISGNTLLLATLKALSLSRAKNLLRYFLYQLGAPMPQTAQLDDMVNQLCVAREDASVCIRFAGDVWQLRRYQGRAYALRALDEFDRNLSVSWRGETELAWPALGSIIEFRQGVGQGISLAKLQGAEVSVCLRQGGETLRPRANGATRTLKNLLQEHHVPPWQRDRLPLLYLGDVLVSVAGIAIAAEYQAEQGEAAIQMSLRGWVSG